MRFNLSLEPTPCFTPSTSSKSVPFWLYSCVMMWHDWLQQQNITLMTLQVCSCFANVCEFLHFLFYIIAAFILCFCTSWRPCSMLQFLHITQWTKVVKQWRFPKLSRKPQSRQSSVQQKVLWSFLLYCSNYHRRRCRHRHLCSNSTGSTTSSQQIHNRSNQWSLSISEFWFVWCNGTSRWE